MLRLPSPAQPVSRCRRVRVPLPWFTRQRRPTYRAERSRSAWRAPMRQPSRSTKRRGPGRFNSSPDFETKGSYTFNVVASDGTLTSAQAVTVSVTDIAPAITSATSVSVPEGTATYPEVYTAAATDVHGGAVSFSLTGADA